jgi:hypothetical protein
MGEIADDMIEGRACELCGQYFVDKNDNLYEHGHPATCWECWTDLTKEEKKNRQRAKVQTI